MGSELASSLLLSGVIGLALGVFGGGGSILAVPMLVLVTHLTPAGAVGTSLAIVGATSLVASYSQHRRGLVRPKVGLSFGLSGVLTSLLGAKLAGLVSGSFIMHAFGALMLVVGFGMLFGRARVAGDGKARHQDPRPVAALLAGAGVGLVTGLLGVGGGFLVVPALVAFAGLDMREAVATSLMVIALNSAAGFMGHIGSGHLDVGLIAVLTPAAVGGALVGERLARQVSTHKLRRSFGLLVIVVGVTVVLAGRPGTNGLRPHGRTAQLLRVQAPLPAPARAWSSGAPFAGRVIARRPWSAPPATTVEEYPWLA